MAGKKKTKKAGIKISIFKIWYLIPLALLFLAVSLFQKPNQSEFCANSISCIKSLTGAYEASIKNPKFHDHNVSLPVDLARADDQKNVLGESTSSDKHIYVDLSKQTLYAYEGSKLVYSFLISSGKWGRTPTGDFTTWIKLRYTTMEGGDKSMGTYYYLPNVPYVMFFYNKDIPKTMGYSIHGTYWHNNFGHPMSHGCINMKIEEAAKIYYWANPPTDGNITYVTTTYPGTAITIYGEAPAE